MNSEMPYTIRSATHFVLPRENVGNGKHAMVKEADFFVSQGGLSVEKAPDDPCPWGDYWIPVVADGMNHARLIAWMIGSDTEHPHSVSFTRPNTKTVGELLGR